MRDCSETGRESRYQLILDGLPDLVFVVDGDGRVVLINQALLNALPSLGVDATPLGRLWQEVFPFFPEMARHQIHRVFETGEAQISRITARIQGREVALQNAQVPIRDGCGGVAEVACLLRDMGEEAHRTDALRRERDLVRAVFESAPLSITVTDLDMRIIDANKRTLQDAHLGSLEDIVGRNAIELIDPSARAQALEKMVLTYREGAVRGLRYPVQRLDGSTHVIEVSAALIRDGQGTPTGYVAFTQDITEETILEERHRQAHRLESMGRFAAGVAHEFNDVIMAIQSYAGFVRDALGGEHQALEDLGELQQAAAQAEELVRQILAFARQTPGTPERFEPNPWIERFFRTVRQILGPEVASDLALGEGIWPVRMAPSAFEQALVHLVVNAQDRMAKGGMLLVRTENMTLSVGASRLPPGQSPGDYVCIIVADTGPEIPAGLRSRIFEPFSSAMGVGDPGQRRPLGLPVVHGIVSQASGFVEVRSNSGEVTEFCLYLPRDRDPSRRADSGEGLALAGKETILLVEDQPQVRASAARNLRQQGYVVLEAGTAEEGLELLDNSADDVDLVLCDVVLPGLSGLDLARLLGASRATLPVVLMSGYAPERFTETSTPLSVAGFLEKPFSARQLLKRVRLVLDRD